MFVMASLSLRIMRHRSSICATHRTFRWTMQELALAHRMLQHIQRVHVCSVLARLTKSWSCQLPFARVVYFRHELSRAQVEFKSALVQVELKQQRWQLANVFLLQWCARRHLTQAWQQHLRHRQMHHVRRSQELPHTLLARPCQAHPRHMLAQDRQQHVHLSQLLLLFVQFLNSAKFRHFVTFSLVLSAGSKLYIVLKSLKYSNFFN